MPSPRITPFPLPAASALAPPLRGRAPTQPLQSAIRTALLGLALGTTAVTGVHAQAAPDTQEANAAQTRAYDLPAGPLGRALSAFAAQSGVALSFDPALTQGLQAPALRGRFSPQQGFAQLLGGSGLQLTPRGDGSYTLQSAPAGAASVLPAVAVAASALSGAAARLTENSGSYTATTVNAGAKLDETLREIPRSISVIARQQLDDQGITSFNEALEQLPGVTLVPGTGINRDAYYTRGYEITQINVDGSPSRGFASSTDNSANTGMAKYDNIQLLRGPDGLFSGNGQPSGSINLVRKRPTEQLQFKTVLSAGSWNNYYGEADLSTPLGANGTVRGRLVAAHHDSEKFYDHSRQRKTTLYGIVEADLSRDTLLSLGFSHDRNRGASDYGPSFPRYVNGKPLPLSRSYGLPAGAGYSDSTATNYFATLEHHFGSDWRARVNVSKTRTEGKPFVASYTGAVDPDSNEGSRLSYSSAYFYDFDYDAADVSVMGSFQWLGRQHRLAVGADYLKSAYDGAYAAPLTGSMPIDWDTFDPGAPQTAHPGLDAPSWIFKGYTRQMGAYAYGRFQLADPLALVAGGRYAAIKNPQAFYRTGTVSNWRTSLDNDGEFTPYYALVYDFAEHWTAYLTMAESYEDQSNYVNAAHHPLDTTRGRSHEFGVKGEFYEGRLNTNLTLYHTRRDNYRVSLGSDPAWSESNPGKNCCYAGDGKFLAQGVEFDISGQLTPNWQINAGYTYDDNKTDYGDNDGVRYASYTPKHIFRLWSSYRLHRALADWKVGGGVKAQSRFFRSGTVPTWNPTGGSDGDGAWDGPAQAFAFTEPGRAIWNAFVEYRVDRHWTAALNINNLFDKHYFASVGDTNGGNIYGEPRSIVLTLRGHF